MAQPERGRGYLHFLAYRDQQPVLCATAYIPDEGQPLHFESAFKLDFSRQTRRNAEALKMMSLKPERDTRLTNALFVAMFDWLRRYDIEHLYINTLHSNAFTHRIYTHYGFHEIGSVRFMEESIVIMRCDLESTLGDPRLRRLHAWTRERLNRDPRAIRGAGGDAA